MANDDDIARLLPEPPPPRPVRREAAIAEALRRFDGGEAPLPVTAPSPPRWRGLGRPQLGVLVSAALIALIGAPAAWVSLHDRFPGAATPAATTNVVDPVTVGEYAAPAPSPSPAAAAALAPPSGPRSPRSAPPVAPPSAVADKAVVARGADDAPAAPQPPMPAMKIAPAPPPPPPPPPAAMARADVAAEARADEAADIAVTASRRSAPRSGRADGYASSADDDIDGAIARFDQALARDPHNSSAWFDRGRARQRKGDLAGALEDLDRAIRLAPEAPAGYRARAGVERQRGDTRRALADERRAAELEAAR